MERPFKKVKEVVLIEALSRRFKARDRSVVVSIGDDAAVLRWTKEKYLLYTVDMLVEGVHFKKGEDLKKVGYKAMAVSVSDIAAMGGLPKHALVSVGLPKAHAEASLRALSAGIASCARQFKVDVIGGDTNRSPHLVVDVFMTGEVLRRHLALRRGARPGDHIFVSGTLGGSLAAKHLSFMPRVKEAQFLVKNFKVTSMMDLSDGLAMDLNRLVQASRCGAMIFEYKIPKSSGCLTINQALCDGEDFELLFTLACKDAQSLLAMTNKKKAPCRFFQIGRMTDLFGGVRMVTNRGRLREIHCRGFQHV
ncbi:MAG: thiamine-phosphate kinase [Candidatus Omnitrophota bacterium]